MKTIPGCISEMWINHKLVDFSNAAKMHGIAPGCTAGEEEADEASKDIIEVETINSDSKEDSVPQERVLHEDSGKNTFVYMLIQFI